MYLCNNCGNSFTRESNLKRHIRESCKNKGTISKKPSLETASDIPVEQSNSARSSISVEPSTSVGASIYLCNNCGKNFTRESNLRRHIRESCKNNGPISKKPRRETASDIPVVPSTSTESSTSIGASTSTGLSTTSNGEVFCNYCNRSIPSNAQVSHMRTLEHRTNACVDFLPGVQLIESAFQRRITSYRLFSERERTDFNRFFDSVRNKFINLLEEIIRVHRVVRVNMELFAKYIIQTQEGQGNSDIKAFNTSNRIIDGSTDLNEAFNVFVNMMLNQTSEFQERDSGNVFSLLRHD